MRIGVRRGSAYDLHPSRTLERAALVRADEGVDVFLDRGLDVGAGRPRPSGYLQAFVEELKASGFVADALERGGRTDVTAAPPAR